MPQWRIGIIQAAACFTREVGIAQVHICIIGTNFLVGIDISALPTRPIMTLKTTRARKQCFAGFGVWMPSVMLKILGCAKAKKILDQWIETLRRPFFSRRSRNLNKYLQECVEIWCIAIPAKERDSISNASTSSWLGIAHRSRMRAGACTSSSTGAGIMIASRTHTGQLAN